jgi:hypothetical protein
MAEVCSPDHQQLFNPKTRQNNGFVYYTTRMLRNAAMRLGPSSLLSPRHKCTVYDGDDDSPL